MRSLYAAFVFGLLMVRPGNARAEDSKRACSNAYEQAQRAKKRGALMEAGEFLLMCGGPSCPEVMHADCERWLTEVEGSVPTVVFEVEDPAHQALPNVQISIDGQPAISLSGRAVSFDPGQHEVRFSAEGFETITRQFFFTEGQKLRREMLILIPIRALATPAAPVAIVEAPSFRRRRTTVPFWIASSVAVLGGAGFAVFGLQARAKDRALGNCSPHCTQEKVDETRTSYLYANVALGVGAAGLVTAAIFFFVNPGSSNTAASSRVQVGVLPTALGASVRLRF